MANFGVYFEVTNGTGVNLGLTSYNLNDSCWDGPSTIPSQPAPTQIHLNDCKMWEGAEGSVNYLGVINGQARLYTWYGSCPVGSSSNSWSGPGITSANGGGHPLTVTIFIDANTKGWTPFPPAAAKNATAQEATDDIKSIKAKLSGKMPAQASDIVKF